MELSARDVAIDPVDADRSLEIALALFAESGAADGDVVVREPNQSAALLRKDMKPRRGQIYIKDKRYCL